MYEVTFKPRSFAGSVLEIFLPIVWIADEMNGFCHACKNNGKLGRIIANVKSPLVKKILLYNIRLKHLRQQLLSPSEINLDKQQLKPPAFQTMCDGR